MIITTRAITPPMRDELVLFEVLFGDDVDLDALSVSGLLDELAGSELLGGIT